MSAESLTGSPEVEHGHEIIPVRPMSLSGRVGGREGRGGRLLLVAEERKSIIGVAVIIVPLFSGCGGQKGSRFQRIE